jgi:hypothetical protein
MQNECNGLSARAYINFTHTHTHTHTHYCVQLVLLIGQHFLKHEAKTDKTKSWI